MLDDQGNPQYTAVQAAQVYQARTIVLLLHDILGNTRMLAQGLRDAGGFEQYDLVLSFDYESLNTSFAETARLLKQRLAEVGLHERHGKQVCCVAHGSGRLVARWLIEREQGASLFKHLVMAGTPNEGSPLPLLQNRVSLGLGLLLKHMAGLVLSAVSGGLAKTLEYLDKGMDELIPNSDMLTMLNSSTPLHVPYTVLAGDATTSDFADWQRLAGKIVGQSMQVLFAGEKHDLAVSYTSQTRIRNGNGSQPAVVEVPCTQFTYFSSPAAVAALRQILETCV